MQQSTGQRATTRANRSTLPLDTAPPWWTEVSEKFGAITQELQSLNATQLAGVAEQRILRQLFEHTIPQTVAGDREQLGALIAERDSFRSQLSTLLTERESLTERLNSLQVERDALRREMSSLLTERNGMEAEREAESKKAEALQAERDALSKEMSSLLTERNELRVERDAQSMRWDIHQAEQASLRSQISSLVAERDELRAARDEHRESTPPGRETSLVAVLSSPRHPTKEDWESLLSEQRSAYTSLVDDLRLRCTKLLPLIPRGAGPSSSWSSTSIQSHVYWKHWLVPLLGPQLSQCVQNTGVTSPETVIARVNRMLPYSVLAAQIYLSETLIRPHKAVPSDIKVSQWVLASMRAAPFLYPEQFLSVAESDPMMLSLATNTAILAIHKQLEVLRSSSASH